VGIFDFFKNLFRSPGRPRNQSATQHPRSSRNLSSRTLPRRSKRHYENGPLHDFQTQLRGRGRPEYPFLSQEYSPTSRVPCADFTSFIIERLRAGDVESIGRLMQGVIAANPGLGINGGWMNKEVESVLQAPLEKYLHFTDRDVYHHLRAIWIIAGKEGGSREFWLTNQTPQFCSKALSPYEMEIQLKIEELIEKGNNFIREMRKDVVYWLDVPLFKEADFQIPPVPEGEAVEKVRDLTIGARLQLFFAVESGGGCLPRLTDYELRKFGLYIPDTSQEITESGLLSLSEDSELLKKTMTKNDLAAACDKVGVSYKKSWNKDKLLQPQRLDGRSASNLPEPRLCRNPAGPARPGPAA
jgi:hypothetical protein